MVFGDEHIALWERGRGSTTENLSDGSEVTNFFRKSSLRGEGILPLAGIARFYGIAAIHKSGQVYEEVWNRLIQPERERDPEKKGFAILIQIDRSEDLLGQPLTPK